KVSSPTPTWEGRSSLLSQYSLPTAQCNSLQSELWNCKASDGTKLQASSDIFYFLRISYKNNADVSTVIPQKATTYYEKPPPGLIKEDETKPEDCIPDVPGNEHAREFLAHAPTKGLWMPLGKEVKVMQCWRCKRYGHRTGDKECPFFIKGNQKLEQFRVAHEDPMYDIIRENKRHEKDIRIQQLKQLLEDSTSDDDSSSSSSSECKERHKKRKKKEKHKKKKKEKKRKKKRKHKSSKSSESSDSD
ncbi:PREDICTED: retinitis pigmentosa 9 protein, partial [Myotis davidii]|uniref:retinitis pigmentosa 9 protein n=1 Tax=Myotis davidii TaxID=225400 RepID=UPI000767290E